jgi:hypothetical protein
VTSFYDERDKPSGSPLRDLVLLALAVPVLFFALDFLLTKVAEVFA